MGSPDGCSYRPRLAHAHTHRRGRTRMERCVRTHPHGCARTRMERREHALGHAQTRKDACSHGRARTHMERRMRTHGHAHRHDAAPAPRGLPLPHPPILAPPNPPAAEGEGAQCSGAPPRGHFGSCTMGVPAAQLGGGGKLALCLGPRGAGWLSLTAWVLGGPQSRGALCPPEGPARPTQIRGVLAPEWAWRRPGGRAGGA